MVPQFACAVGRRSEFINDFDDLTDWYYYKLNGSLCVYVCEQLNHEHQCRIPSLWLQQPSAQDLSVSLSLLPQRPPAQHQSISLSLLLQQQTAWQHLWLWSVWGAQRPVIHPCHHQLPVNRPGRRSSRCRRMVCKMAQPLGWPCLSSPSSSLSLWPFPWPHYLLYSDVTGPGPTWLLSKNVGALPHSLAPSLPLTQTGIMWLTGDVYAYIFTFELKNFSFSFFFSFVVFWKWVLCVCVSVKGPDRADLDIFGCDWLIDWIFLWGGGRGRRGVLVMGEMQSHETAVYGCYIYCVYRVHVSFIWPSDTAHSDDGEQSMQFLLPCFMCTSTCIYVCEWCVVLSHWVFVLQKRFVHYKSYPLLLLLCLFTAALLWLVLM